MDLNNPASKFQLGMLITAGILCIGLLVIPAAQVGTFQALHAFAGTDGALPRGGLVIADGGGSIEIAGPVPVLLRRSGKHHTLTGHSAIRRCAVEVPTGILNDIPNVGVAVRAAGELGS